MSRIPIQIKQVTKDNWFQCTQLEISEENGKRFIVPIVYSLAESKFEEHLQPLALYAESELVGFSMYALDPDDGRYWIYVFMIDAKHQRKGYGKAGLRETVKHIRELHKCQEIMIGHKPDNIIASGLYEGVSFEVTGEVINGEIIRRIKVK